MVVFGLNQNVKYQGRVYHVQTEDSGRNNPHIITHLYTEGVILDSRKTEYDDILEVEDLEKILKELMLQQHRGVLEALKNGEYDEILPDAPGEGGAGGEALDTNKAVAAEKKVNAEAKAKAKAAAKVAADKKAAKAKAAAAKAAAQQAAHKEAAKKPAAPPPIPPPPPLPPPADGEAKPAGAPPPAAPPGRAAVAPGHDGHRPAPAPRPTGPKPQPAPRPEAAGAAARGPAPPRRFAQKGGERPPSIFGRQAPEPKQDTIFGEDLISERSLDEVILGYLADDLTEE